jgi:hypothetical protein
MTMFIFAALTAIALTIAWATVAVALRQSPQEQVTTKETGPESAGGSRLLMSAFGDRVGALSGREIRGERSMKIMLGIAIAVFSRIANQSIHVARY